MTESVANRHNMCYNSIASMNSHCLQIRSMLICKKRRIVMLERIFILLLVFALLITGCNFSTRALSPNEAVELVESALISKEANISENMQVEYDGEIEVAGNDYYRIHVYSTSTMELEDYNGNPYRQTFTYAWLCVDINTGAIYEEEPNAVGDSLVPWSTK